MTSADQETDGAPMQRQMSIRVQMGRVEWAMLIVLSILWGGSFFFVEVAVNVLPPLTIVLSRVGLAAIMLWIIVLISGRTIPRKRRTWLAFLGMGLLNNIIPFGLIVWGQQNLASGLASILNGTTPLFAVLVAGVFLPDERVSFAKIVGVVAGFVGVAVMMGYEALSGLGAHVIAQGAVLVAALSYAFAGVFGRRFKTLGVDPVVTAAGQVTASSLLLLPIVLLIEQPLSLKFPSFAVCAALVGLAFLSTVLAYILYFQLLARAGATNLLLVTFLIPVSAILLGWLVLDERLSVMHFVGMSLIGFGLLAIDGRIFARFGRKKPDLSLF